MKYEFPVITNISQVREAIKWHAAQNDGKTEFIIAEREGFLVANYLVSLPGTFPAADNDHAAILRECRGLTFYQDGTVAARKFHKFFNLNERPETEFRKIDWTQTHVILEKLDGSMITPFQMPDGEIQWHTKMGKTDVADFVIPFVKENPQYNELAFELTRSCLTPILEFCSRKNRIVIDHPKDRLVLLAVRNNQTGEYWTYDRLLSLSKNHNIELVRQYEGTVETMEKFVEDTRDEKDIEGYVIAFADGHRLKIKCDVYVTLHKAVSQLQQEKDVWRLILEDKIDDLKAILMDDQRDRIELFETDLWKSVNKLIDIVKERDLFSKRELDKRDYSMFDDPVRERKKMFALEYAQMSCDQLKPVAYRLFDGANVRETVLDWIRGHLNTGTQLEKIRWLFGVQFNPGFGEG